MESLWALCCKSLVKVTKLVLVSVGWVVYNENDTVSLASKSTCQKSLDVATGDVKAAAEAGAERVTRVGGGFKFAKEEAPADEGGPCCSWDARSHGCPKWCKCSQDSRGTGRPGPGHPWSGSLSRQPSLSLDSC